MTRWAYVDESMRAPRPDLSGVYVLAAAVLESAEVPDCRASMRALSPKPGTRLHWRDEPPQRRQTAVSVITDLCPLHVTVTGSPLDPHRQERARRLCLQQLLSELEHAGVERVWFDSRRQHQDRLDIEAIDAFRARRILGRTLRADHIRSADEPLLWIADVVAGVLSTDDVKYLEPLDRSIVRHTVRLH